MRHNKIKKILILITLTSLFIGCATAKKSQEYLEACLQDQKCVDQMNVIKQSTSSSVSSIVDSVPNKISPFADVIGYMVGSLVSYFYGVRQGKKLKKVG